MSEVAQSCPTLCDPMDCNLSGSSVHGIFQAIVLEWIAIFFSRGSSQSRDRTQVSRIVDTLYCLSHHFYLPRALPTAEQQRPSASMGTEPQAATAVDLQHPLREFRVEGGTQCSRESGGTGLQIVGCFRTDFMISILAYLETH